MQATTANADLATFQTSTTTGIDQSTNLRPVVTPNSQNDLAFTLNQGARPQHPLLIDHQLRGGRGIGQDRDATTVGLDHPGRGVLYKGLTRWIGRIDAKGRQPIALEIQ
ncbi:hypothetical protein D3C76_602610 [compost metagenome]